MSKRVFTQTFRVAGAIIERNGKIILVKETKKIAEGLWSHPAGWINVGEDPLKAVKREVKEETGYNFKPTYILGIYSLYKKHFEKNFNIKSHAIKIIFIGKISNNNSKKLAADVLETKWFFPEEIYKMDKNTLRSVDIKKMVKDYFIGKRYPLEMLVHIISK